jgi:gas vesicle protein
MTDLKNKLQSEFEDLKRLRDEVRVQAKLGEAEAKKLWERVEGQWPEVERKLRDFESQVDEASGEAAHRVLKATRDLYEDVRRRFTPKRR